VHVRTNMRRPPQLDGRRSLRNRGHASHYTPDSKLVEGDSIREIGTLILMRNCRYPHQCRNSHAASPGHSCRTWRALKGTPAAELVDFLPVAVSAVSQPRNHRTAAGIATRGHLDLDREDPLFMEVGAYRMVATRMAGTGIGMLTFTPVIHPSRT